MFEHLHRYTKADYYGADIHRKSSATGTGGSRAMGPGETVRLDHVMISRRDPHLDPATWHEQENVAFMAYIDRYAQDYKAGRFLKIEYNAPVRAAVADGGRDSEDASAPCSFFFFFFSPLYDASIKV